MEIILLIWTIIHVMGPKCSLQYCNISYTVNNVGGLGFVVCIACLVTKLNVIKLLLLYCWCINVVEYDVCNVEHI